MPPPCDATQGTANISNSLKLVATPPDRWWLGSKKLPLFWHLPKVEEHQFPHKGKI